MSSWMEREIGKLESRLTNVERELRSVRKDVRENRDLLVGFRGGWQAIALLVAALSSVFAVLVALPWQQLLPN